MNRLLRRLSREDGLTLVELMVSSAILMIVAASVMTVLESAQTGLVRQDRRSRINDQARLAIQQLDREIRSGNVVYDPAGETPANYSIRVHTQANATTRTPPTQCVQWKIVDKGADKRELLRRSWPSGGSATEWRTVAERVWSEKLAIPAFKLTTTPGGGRVVDVVLIFRPEGPVGVSQDIRVETSIALRNSSSGDPCSPVPAG